IGLNASSIIANTVSFTSGDLTSSTSLYCFNFVSNASKTSPSAGSKTATVEISSANSVLESKKLAITIIDNDQITISGKVPSKSFDYSLALSSPTTDTTVLPNQMLEFTISYGSSLAFASSFTIEATWSLGILPQHNLSTFDILSYVPGSATSGYGQVTPTIDTSKRKIRWKIASFPKKTTDQRVSFKLKTPSRFVTNQNLDFTVGAKLYTDTISTESKTLAFTYSPKQFIDSQIKELEILGLEIRKIEKTSFSMLIKTSQPTRTTIYYGTGGTLDKTFTDPNLRQQKMLTISGLEPLTTYSFQVKIENEKGMAILVPDIFTVTTASESLFSAIEVENMMITVSGIILKNKASATNREFAPAVPADHGIDLVIPFKTTAPAKVYAKFVPAQILGINNLDPVPYLEKIRLLETEANVVSGKIMPPPTPGPYELILEAHDEEGAVSSDLLTKLRVIERMKILDASSMPVEGAFVYLERYDPKQHIFEYFEATSFGFKNPQFSESDGSLALALPEGKYKFKISAIGFKPQENIIIFSQTGNYEYPKIILEKSPFSFTNTTFYYLTIAGDMAKYINHNLKTLSSSYRFFDFAVFVGFLVLSTLSILLLTHRLEIHLDDTLLILDKYWRFLTVRKNSALTLFTGIVQERDLNLPIHAAQVILLTRDGGRVIDQGLTNYLGEFHLKVPTPAQYDVMIKKKGFDAIKITLNPATLKNGHFVYQLARQTGWLRGEIIEFIIVVLTSFVHLLSELIFFLSITFGLLLSFKWSMPTALPVLLLSLVNIILWAELAWYNFTSIKRFRVMGKVRKE
ncbi:MAG: hypothetical protein ACOY0S_01225, partial [Patescibacteria group bacterium]